MKIKINKIYLIVFIILLCIEIYIAAFVKDTFFRPFFGDVLVVMLIYSFIRIFYSRHPVIAAFGVFLFACIVEVLQLFHIARVIGVEQNMIARIIIGSTFDWNDIIAYVTGTACVLLSIFVQQAIIQKKHTGESGS